MNGKVIYRSKAGVHPCRTPWDGFLWWGPHWDAGDKWQCKCGRIWTRYWTWAGDGWESDGDIR